MQNTILSGLIGAIVGSLATIFLLFQRPIKQQFMEKAAGEKTYLHYAQ